MKKMLITVIPVINIFSYICVSWILLWLGRKMSIKQHKRRVSIWHFQNNLFCKRGKTKNFWTTSVTIHFNQRVTLSKSIFHVFFWGENEKWGVCRKKGPFQIKQINKPCFIRSKCHIPLLDPSLVFFPPVLVLTIHFLPSDCALFAEGPVNLVTDRFRFHSIRSFQPHMYVRRLSSNYHSIFKGHTMICKIHPSRLTTLVRNKLRYSWRRPMYHWLTDDSINILFIMKR